MARERLSIGRRTFLALVAAGSGTVAACSSPNRPTERLSTETQMSNLDRVYEITENYHVGPKRDRPQPGDAEGTIWETTDPGPAGATRRSLSDGERWIPLVVEPESPRATGEYHLTPDDGFEAIQTVIDRTGGNVVIRLAPGTYVGRELTLEHGVMLVGSGRNATTLKLEDGANTDLVTTPDLPDRNVMECTLRDLMFDGNRGNNATGNAVYGAFWNSRFVDCNFYAAPGNGFWLAGSTASTDDNQFRGCQFLNNGAAGLRGGGNKRSYPSVGVARVDTNWFGYNGGPAITARGESWKVSDSKFYANGLDGDPTIEFDRCSYSNVTGCDIHSDYPDHPLILVSASKGVESIGNQIKSNDLRGTYRSAVRCLVDGNDIVALQIHDNTIQSNGRSRSGVVAREAGPGSFVDCSFRNNTFVGTMTGQAVGLPDSWRTNANSDAG
ncbi:right-handed parallel beta-helix repeat-containing protein [Halococcus sp. IIIV-5B]|uniref:right-handed parallel beta-helix repeat-containing protein n=1 Tax=Halococcus sp. IIIV-5B TaxID=2321230 RepID=UPI000E7221B5|nr:right-handed parallel beta-helix repeat-containing protein [Halococcus sp. IIIV-5B]RJT03285.1 right-handed parallel beta-helix repeat-containing protein [Halococcus sp. IIIV-5B]